MAFTKEQLQAINSEGSNIIVSAGAGSGKTAVLTERVIRKLKDGVDIDKLLILTFTNEAANEMKNRIRKAIIKNNLNNQLDLIDSSYITTFDSYAFSLVKKYHYILNISNDIKITTSGIITIYKYKIIDQIFEDMYGNTLFNQMINDYCLKDDILLKKFIIDISNKLDLLTNKEEYLNNYLDNFYNDNYINNLILEYDKLIKSKINEIKDIYDNFSSYCTDYLINKLDDYFKPLFNGQDYDDFVLFKTMSSVRFVGVSEEGIKLKEELKDNIDEIKLLLRFDNKNDIIDGINSTKEYISLIIDIVRKLDSYVNTYKDKYQIYEFNDISHMALSLVKNNISIRSEIKEYFNEIMVDEYQDTSSIQEEFINYIANNNIYMVGDIKQSIYRFRNANPYIFQDKYNRYSNNDSGIKIDLLKNFRSRNETLFNINEIFNLIMDDEIGNADYIRSHNMVYGNTLYDNEDTMHNNMMEVYTYKMEDDDKYSREEKELFVIAKDIKEKIDSKYQVFDKDSGKLRDIRYSDICIITDRNKYLEDYKKILEYKEIPSVLYIDYELGNNMVILAIRNLIDLIIRVNDKIFDDKFRYLFTSVARSFIFEYEDNKIYNTLMNKEYYSIDIVKLAKEMDLSLPIPVVINNIIDKFKIYDKLINVANVNDNIIRINNLLDIGNSLNDLGYSLTDFINYLTDMEELGLSVKYSLNTSNKDAVKIMNIHKSKGLEFSLCYFTGMHNKFTIRDISSKYLITDKYGIIIPYIKDNELCNNILKDLYVDKFYHEEISEKIRLFYVALTRCREKMIILANLDEVFGYNKLVPNSVRIKYRSFLDILKSINIINKYMVNKDMEYTKDYKKLSIKKIEDVNNNDLIKLHELNIKYELIDNQRFSKNKIAILSDEEIKKMDYGTKIHEVFEYDDFKNPSSNYVKNLLKLIDNNFVRVFHEYEFNYLDNNTNYYGIIDLMVEYDNVIYIIDYKLKNITDNEYNKQLSGYKKYIMSITNKNVKTFLYSVIDNVLKEVYDE